MGADKLTEGIVATTVHGRHVVAPPDSPGPAPLLAGFHGYAEDAEIQLARLCAIPGSERWLRVSIQALHPFYNRRMDRVVASWMTRQQREHAIADNLAYVEKTLEAVDAKWPALPCVVFAGFSQGVATAFRAAANSARDVAGVIAVGSGIPPEISAGRLQKIQAVLMIRGTSDNWYTPEQFADDERRLRESLVNARFLEWNGGHEWSAEVNSAAEQFLRDCCDTSLI